MFRALNALSVSLTRTTLFWLEFPELELAADRDDSDDDVAAVVDDPRCSPPVSNAMT